jgi:SAM-dependent methyltransferase
VRGPESDPRSDPRGRPVERLLARRDYVGVEREDPIRFYFWPLLGALYRRRVELCLAECTGGRRILEVGFGSGVSFPNLAEKYQEIHGIDLTADTERVAAAWRSRGIETRLERGDVLELPFHEGVYDTVLLVSILEHLRPPELATAFAGIRRVLRPGGQVVYGVPVERPLMSLAFRLLGYDIREHHFSTEAQVREAAARVLAPVRVIRMRGLPLLGGHVYEVGHWVRDGRGEG